MPRNGASCIIEALRTVAVLISQSSNSLNAIETVILPGILTGYGVICNCSRSGIRILSFPIRIIQTFLNLSNQLFYFKHTNDNKGHRSLPQFAQIGSCAELLRILTTVTIATKNHLVAIAKKCSLSHFCRTFVALFRIVKKN